MKTYPISNSCPECGAELAPGEQCRDRFDTCMALEFENPSTFGSVHHLTVACYYLQHNAYSHQAWLIARQGVSQAVNLGITPGEVRMGTRRALDSGNREWNVTRGARMPGADTLQWTRTIADVRTNDPELYGADVRDWAKSVLSDTESLV